MKIQRVWLGMALLLACLGMARVTMAADWPTYAKDLHRGNVTDEALALPLRPAWAYHCAQPPRPAWPEPVKVLNRLDFDYAFHPVIAGGLLYFGSSADDTVRALDAATGKEKWHFITGGPVRFAPQVADGKVYFSADDGVIYCLDAATGKPVWTFDAAPADERMLGNERMISRWPARTGVLVDNGVLYCTAGMWPSEGVFVYALDAATGKVIWCNDTSGLIYEARTLHMGSDFATYGVCPQGPMLLSGDTLLVPTGKALPAAYDRKTGKLLYYRISAEFNQRGGTWITIDGDRFFTTPYIAAFSLATGAVAGRISASQIPAYKHNIPGKAYALYDKVSVIVKDGTPIARKAYGLIKAGNILIEGQPDAVIALDAKSRQELWRAEVEGEARGLAVADGRLFVSTSLGKLYCFSPAAVGDNAAVAVHRPVSPTPPAPNESAARVTAQLREAGIDRGYALVIGDADGRLSTALAHASGLHILNLLAEERAASALREKLLAATAFYGSRIHVQVAPRFDQLPFAAYFASAVIVAGPAPGLSGSELYRVLRPCGGLLICPGLPPSQAQGLLAASGAPPAEVRDGAVVRGRLPGALDWDSPFPLDQRVKWPLRLLWFGGPGPADVMDRKTFTNIGPAANGRMFNFAQDAVTAVDAYNGAVLWSRPVPKTFADLRLADEINQIVDAERLGGKDFGRQLHADGDNVYLTLKGYFGKEETACVVLDARTGAQRKIFGPFNPSPLVSLAAPQSWPLEIDEAHGGVLTLKQDADGLLLTLATRDPVITSVDRWDLYFDFRPPATRYGLYDRGAFSLAVFPADGNKPARLEHGKGEAIPAATVAGTRTGHATTTTVRLPWSELVTLAGEKPISFGFGARLNAFDGGAKERVAQRYLFCDLAADGLNNGWATMQLAPGATAGTTPPAIIAGAYADAPKVPPLRGRNVPRGSQPSAQESRRHPLTGQVMPKYFQAGTFGCGGPAYSAATIFTRSTAIGIYDFADDSGMRTFDGLKPGCATTMTVSQGLLLSMEGRGGCECTSNFQTTMAMAPVETRSHEDWALYFDHEVDARVRSAALNLGAPGDRRADDGTLWLGFPRIQQGVGIPQLPPNVVAQGYGRRKVAGNLHIPLEMEFFAGSTSYRVNADRVPFAGTGRPWIYASGYRGPRKATLALNFETSLISAAAPQPPTLDGIADDDAWAGEPQATLEVSKTEVFLRHDAEHLYILARRPSVISRTGDVVKWTKTVVKDDMPFYNDECWEVFLTDARSERVVHLRVMASGARFDALSESPAQEKANVKWNGAWRHAVVADEKGFAIEMAIPWTTLTEAGLNPETLAINFMMNGPFRVTEALRFLGMKGRERCENFVPLGLGAPPRLPAVRPYTVRLHFAEIDEVQPGERVFDVMLQGRLVLKGLDIVKEAGGARKALVKEFTHVQAGDTLALEFIPAAREITERTAPLLSGLEIFEELLHE